MNTALVASLSEAVLVPVFTYSGVVKATQPIHRIVALGQTGVEGLPVGLVRFIGVSELCGVAGLLLPQRVGVIPVLTPLAAACLGLIMILAARVHARRREYGTVAGNLLVLALCVLVAVARW